MKNISYLFVLALLVSCSKEIKPELKSGMYRASLEALDGEVIPFNFKVISKDSLEVYNAEEVIVVDEIRYENDSVYIQMPVFESYLSAKISDSNTLKGFYVKPNLGRTVPFYAEMNETRFNQTQDADFNVSGNWEAVFSPHNEAESSVAKGIFKQQGNAVTGTFRTTTGDYRFLDGSMNGNVLKLSAFDGSHAFLFVATVGDSTMQGTFYSGNHFKEPFVAKRNEGFELPDADSLTFLKEGYDKLDFSFPDSEGNMVSIEDERFKNKVVLVQLMGTWCPNCLDETKFLSDYYKENKEKDLEFVALAFEYAKTDSLAFVAINRLKSKTGLEYPVLLAQSGSSSKGKAQEKLPMLNHVWSYPTTIFIDKEGKVRKIHTGFNGPATGEKFTEFKTEFQSFMNTLLEE